VVKNATKWYKVVKYYYFYTIKKLQFYMSTFIGDYICKLDSKGRLMLPSVFKKQMGPETQFKFIVKKDIFVNCLILYPFDEWEKQVKTIRENINSFNREHNRFLREFYRGTAEVTLDNTNRLLIPKRLLDLVNIGNEVVLAGLDGKIEMWDKKVYETIGESDSDFAELAEKIMGSKTNKTNE
jgi:MraZ protein